MNNFRLVRERLHELFPKVKFTLRVGKSTRRVPKLLYVVWVNGPTEAEVREQIRLALCGQETDALIYYSQSDFEVLCGRAASQSGKSIRDMGVRLIEQFEPLRRKRKQDDNVRSPRSQPDARKRGAR